MRIDMCLVSIIVIECHTHAIIVNYHRSSYISGNLTPESQLFHPSNLRHCDSSHFTRAQLSCGRLAGGQRETIRRSKITEFPGLKH
jgi:hypothetical protein